MRSKLTPTDGPSLFITTFFFCCFRSIETFRKVLSLSPDFARLSEIFVRLGMMHKSKGEYSLALEVGVVTKLTDLGVVCGMSWVQIDVVGRLVC